MAPSLPRSAPVPPVPLPPARTVLVPDRGEFFVRDSGGPGPAGSRAAGWVFGADTHRLPAFGAVQDAGDPGPAKGHRGPGRGPARPGPFPPVDCAGDAPR